MLARFTGEFRRCGIPRPAMEDGKPVFKRPLHAKFYQHDEPPFMVRASKIFKTDKDGVRAYLGRRHNEPIGGEPGNAMGANARVQFALMKQAVANA